MNIGFLNENMIYKSKEARLLMKYIREGKVPKEYVPNCIVKFKETKFKVTGASDYFVNIQKIDRNECLQESYSIDISLVTKYLII